MDTSKKFIPVDEWHRDKNDAYIYSEDGMIKLNLDKCIPKSIDSLRRKNPERTDKLGKFTLSRKAFKNSGVLISDYVDYFIEFYDDDKELPSLYIHWKDTMESSGKMLSAGEFKEMLFRTIFKESNLKSNIYRMVEDNHYIDVTVDEKTGRKFDSKEDFTNDNVKRYLAIAMMMKIIIPVFDHFITLKLAIPGALTVPVNVITTKLFSSIMYKMGNVHGDEGADEIIEKLYLFVSKKTSKHAKDNTGSWEQQSALRGVTENTHIDMLTTKYIIYDNIFKLKFNNNMLSFIKSILNKQLRCTIEIPQFDSAPVRIDTTRGPDGIAEGLHNVEQQLTMIDESLSIIIDESLIDVISRLEQEVGEVTKEEIDYYEKFIVHTDWFQGYLLMNMLAKEFDGFQELKVMSNRQYITLMVITKRRLKAQGYKELQWVLSAVPQGKLSNRLLRNTKILNRIESSETHERLMEDTFVYLKNFKDNEDINIISKIIYNQYLFNEYDRPDLTGEPIIFNEDRIAAEVQRFMDYI